ncbi:MAG: hypothetical protein ACUVWR_03785 [Anaerolineae bacterium]
MSRQTERTGSRLCRRVAVPSPAQTGEHSVSRLGAADRAGT